MKQIEKRFYKNGEEYEEFEILYQTNDNKYVLVKNLTTNTKNKYSFGLYQDLHSFYGFPVNQSCLNKKECLKILQIFIKINKEYNQDVSLYKSMINALKKDKINGVL